MDITTVNTLLPWSMSLVAVISIVALVCHLFSDGDLSLMWAEKFGKSVDSLAGRVIWITGASSGIGEDLAYELARIGCKLALSARRENELERVRKQCLFSGNLKEEDVMIYPLDLSDITTHKTTVEDVLAHFGHIDILVNNAGRSQRASILDTSIEVDRQMYETNTLGTISITKEVLPYMVKRQKGQLVVTSSLAGKVGLPLAASYSTSKFALHGWFETLRMELFSDNIDVCMVCPGTVYSNILHNAFTGVPGKNLEGTIDKTKKRVTSSRCAALMTVAMANRLEEVWISLQPILLLVHIIQYMPTIGKRLAKRIGPAVVKRVRGNN